ncbi:MAG TPA: dUTP diphosphatase [Vicinamibacterales bacterium]|nr:dUTP diphosphatase [Vicinamibacterales bacterium]
MADPLRIPIKRLPGGEGIPLPAYQTTHAAALDLAAAVREPLTIAPGAIAVIPCGFAIALPVGYEGQVRPRSGLASRYGLTVVNAPGTIDADYRGEVKVALINLGSASVVVEHGMRIAQLVIAPVHRIEWDETGELPPSERGVGGFGHTGT